MEIIELTEKYVKDVANIERECFSRPWNEASIEAELENDFSRFLIAVENGRAVGYVGLYVLTGEADVVRVAVCPSTEIKALQRRF